MDRPKGKNGLLSVGTDGLKQKARDRELAVERGEPEGGKVTKGGGCSVITIDKLIQGAGKRPPCGRRRGRENYRERKGRKVILVNHTRF